VILVVGREFAISGLRGIAAAEGYTIRASDLGKTKMMSQVVAVVLLLMSLRFRGCTAGHAVDVGRPRLHAAFGRGVFRQVLAQGG